MIVMPYFEPGTLRAGFITALETAQRDLSLSIIEARWLRRLADQTSLPASMRVEVTGKPPSIISQCSL